ncbi:hypothetical protein ATANTOWER_009718, partial [Ataeniobius toweri]|nr:hypothetical protein [Ataeniobius toweri]
LPSQFFLHLFFPLSSPPQATPRTCDLTDSLMLHYPYTSLSMSASLKAMFTYVASKLGHELDAHGHMKGLKWWQTGEIWTLCPSFSLCVSLIILLLKNNTKHHLLFLSLT